ncbi:ribonuclease E inhibitor RraB [Nocardia arizonensis]|uniref:ribonuclease E inhibitor RraB n=1 Tax=Nocardia arizonensis TaxID=1141647 RepID=UPI0006D25655|nr:ribonuclease E inhibitor RraB [Nocardia arizonensis]
MAWEDSDGTAEEVEAHESKNEILLEVLLEQGAILDAPRPIDCHFRAHTYESAQILATKLLDKGFDNISVTSPDNAAPWSVEGQFYESARVMAGRQVTQMFIRLAATCGGSYGGWGTVVHETEPSR